MASFSDLPDELLLQIFELGDLDQADFRNACLVSKQLGRVAPEFLYRSPFIGSVDRYPGHPVESLASSLIQRPDLGLLTRSITLQLPNNVAAGNEQTGLAPERAETEAKKHYQRNIPNWLSIILASTPKLNTLDVSGPSEQQLPNYFFSWDGYDELAGGAWLKSLRQLRIQQTEPPNEWRIGANNIETLERECSIHLLDGLGMRSSWERGFWSSFPKLTTLRLNCFPFPPEIMFSELLFVDLARGSSPLADTLEVLEFLNPTQMRCFDWFEPFGKNGGDSSGIWHNGLKAFSKLKRLVIPQAAIPFYPFDIDPWDSPRDVFPESLEMLGLWSLDKDILKLLETLNGEHDQLPKLQEVRLAQENVLLQMDRNPLCPNAIQEARFRIVELE